MSDEERQQFADRCDDTGWAALTAATVDVDADRLLAALDGERTSALPETAAVKVLRRLSATRGPEAARAAAAGDDRRRVVDALEAAELASSNLRFAALQRTALVASASKAVVTSPTAMAAVADIVFARDASPATIAATVAELLSARPWPVLATADEEAVSAAAHLVPPPLMAGFTETIAATAPLRDPWRHVTLAAAATAARDQRDLTVAPRRLADAGVGHPDLLAAARWVYRRFTYPVAGPGGELSPEGLCVRLLTWAIELGAPLEGDTSLAAALGLDFDQPDPGARGDVALVLHAARNARDAVLFDATLVAAVRAGPGALPDLDLSGSSPALPPEVLLEVSLLSPSATRPPDVVRFVDAVLGRFGHRWSADEVLAAFDEHPEAADVILERLPALDQANMAPRWLIVESVRRVGLGPWLGNDTVAAELRAATRGLDADGWRVAASLLASFSGMPAELVDVCSQLTPTSAPASASAA